MHPARSAGGVVADGTGLDLLYAVRGTGADRHHRRRGGNRISANTVVLTVAFAIGATSPLLLFALAGRRMSERIAAFRRRQRSIRGASGVVMILRDHLGEPKRDHNRR